MKILSTILALSLIITNSAYPFDPQEEDNIELAYMRGQECMVILNASISGRYVVVREYYPEDKKRHFKGTVKENISKEFFSDLRNLKVLELGDDDDSGTNQPGHFRGSIDNNRFARKVALDKPAFSKLQDLSEKLIKQSALKTVSPEN